jgi:hypothetical protein
MKTVNVINEPMFIETLSSEFVAITGYGVYVYLNPIDIDQLFRNYINRGIPARIFAQQCVKKTVG